VTTADAISVIVVIMRHMRFLVFVTTATKPDKELTEEVSGIFPRRGVRKCFFDSAE
jgi:adenosylmethionine-8-amino-7-oxononanoate aminotransferase